MTVRLNHARVLIYSHDTFGLGHLRRCRAIAHSLIDRYKGLSVLIISGSPIIGSFDFRARVDFVRVPGVIKLRNGDYISLGLHIDLEDTLKIRTAIIQQTTETFAPDVFLVDKEPLGFRGEVVSTLTTLRKKGCTTILGLRDIMDEAVPLQREWQKKGVFGHLEELYDQIWVYGHKSMGDPLSGLTVKPQLRQNLLYTGYIKQPISSNYPGPLQVTPPDPYILVTAGGGADGEHLIDWVLRAYEQYPDLPIGALVVFGPFMASQQQLAFQQRVDALSQVAAITFDSQLDSIMAKSVGVIAMGGYNTFCEILALDKPAVLVPRTEPRKEQWLRASRAQKLGLCQMLEYQPMAPAAVMADVLLHLSTHPQQPSAIGLDGFMSGLDTICQRMESLLPWSQPENRTRNEGMLP
ncbi:MAG TPA: hypothetical protein ENI62_02775 [Gammaproteobacteria bacterium]|nr:hypothetical protein [Gammaproteobacteria bacterium]